MAKQQEINEVFRDFQSFGEPSLINALYEAQQFCLALASSKAPAYWLSLLGPSGIGKTMLAKRIVRFFDRYLDGFLDEKYSAPGKQIFYRRGGFKPWIKVVDEMIGGDFTGLRNLSDDWLVVLDDVAVGYSRHLDLAANKLYEVLNNREGRFTVLTANMSLQGFNEKFDARIASRMIRHGNIVIDVTAKDFNLR